MMNETMNAKEMNAMKALVTQTITNKNFLLENVRIGLVKNAKDERFHEKGTYSEVQEKYCMYQWKLAKIL